MPVLKRAAGAPPRSDRGVALDLRMHAMLRLTERAGLPKMHELPPERSRRSTDAQALLADGRGPSLWRVRDDRIAGADGPLDARIYVPRRSSEPLPLLVFFHGGGFVIGSLASHDTLCRVLAREAGCIVVSVAYRLAPEHRFPSAVDDAIAAFDAVGARASELGGRPERVAVGGDSAGGNLSAVVCQATREREHPPCHQLLIYPVTDMTRSLPSHRTLAHGFFLEKQTMDCFLEHYTPSTEDRRDVRASPLLCEDLEGLPPATVATAGFDALRDEGEKYAARLHAAGVDTAHLHEPALVHGYCNMGRLVPRAAQARRALARRLGRRLRETARP
ncbi:MAG: alpha/beta hydrolase [Polyangiales bacterium]